MAKSASLADKLKGRFTKADAAVKARLIGLSFGEVGSGKTSFWLGAPGPIVLQSFDKGLEGVIEQFQAEKDIFVREYDWSPTDDLTQADAVALRDEFIEDFEQAIQHGRTVLWDKETNVWELFRYAEFGEPNDAPRNYPALNQRYRKYLQMPKATDVNFGIIQSMKDHWVTKTKSDGGSKGFNTGERVPQGFSEAEEIVHIVLAHEREDGEFRYTVGKSRGPGSREVQDNTFPMTDPLTAFREFATLLFPETEESDWA